MQVSRTIMMVSSVLTIKMQASLLMTSDCLTTKAFATNEHPISASIIRIEENDESLFKNKFLQLALAGIIFCLCTSTNVA